MIGRMVALVAVVVMVVALSPDPPLAAAGSGLSITSVAVEPPEPTERDLIRITVEGTMSSTCPVSSSHELFENFILVLNVFIPPGSICLHIPGSFSVTEEIDRLPAGVYQVVAYCGVSVSPCGSTTFIVTPFPIGGIAELPEVAETPLEAEGSSGASASVVAGVVAAVAAGAVALGGAAWYARWRLR